MANDLSITADYFPAIPRTEIAKSSKYNFSLGDLNTLGSGFAVVAAAVAEAATAAPVGEGLYRCVFPDGVTGKLASFKDGSGYLGTIVNEDGIAAQARWLPADGASVTLPIDPTTLAVAAVLMQINKKLDQIQETQEEILRFLQQDKESKLEGAVNSLADILNQYHYNSDNELWKASKLTVVTSIKATAENNIIFYRKELQNAFEKQRMLHGTRAADKLKTDLEHGFRYYQLGVYLFSYASFLEVLLGGNYAADYLEHMSGIIREYAFQYRVDYTNCYDQLEGYMKSSVQSVALKGLGKASSVAGKAISKIPVISKGPVDEALVAMGDKLHSVSDRHKENALYTFRNNRDAGTQMFLDSIEAIDEMSNHPVELFFNKETVYLCA